MYQPLTEASPGNGAEPCLTQATTIRGVTDAKPIYFHASQGIGLEDTPIYKGLGLALLLAGMSLVMVAWLVVRASASMCCIARHYLQKLTG